MLNLNLYYALKFNRNPMLCLKLKKNLELLNWNGTRT